MCYCVERVSCSGPWCPHAARVYICANPVPCPLNPGGDDDIARACPYFVRGLKKEAFIARPRRACQHCAQPLAVQQAAAPAQQSGNNGGLVGGGAQSAQQQQQQPAPAAAGGGEEEEDEGEAMDLDPQPSLIIEQQGVPTPYGVQKLVGEKFDAMNIRR